MDERQTKIITIIPRVTASISLACSLFILLDVSGMLARVFSQGNKWISHKSKLDRVQPRLVFAMSVADFIASLMLVLGDVVFPPEYGGKGNIGTCNAGGWLIQMVPVAAMYNAALSLYYVLTVSYQKNELSMKKFEKWAHATIFFFWIATGTAGVVLGLFNPALFDCWIFDEPAFCSEIPGLECNRPYYGVSYVAAQYYLYYIWIYAAFVICAVAMFMVYKTVYNQEKKMTKYGKSTTSSSQWQGRSEVGGKGIEASASSTIGPLTRSSVETKDTTDTKDQFKRSRRVASQGIFYVGAFYITWFIPTINQIYANVTGALSPFPLFCLAMFFIPLQGFFNFMVYMRPRFVRKKTGRSQSSAKSEAYLPPLDRLKRTLRRGTSTDEGAVSEIPVTTSVADNNDNAKDVNLSNEEEAKEEEA